MNFADLFDGEEHWLDPNAEPGWKVPDLVPGEPVELAVQVPALTELESPEINYAPHIDERVSLAWRVEWGWSALSVDLQYIGELLSPPGQKLLKAEQLVERDGKTWKVTDTHYRVLWTGDPDLAEGL